MASNDRGLTSSHSYIEDGGTDFHLPIESFVKETIKNQQTLKPTSTIEKSRGGATQTDDEDSEEDISYYCQNCEKYVDGWELFHEDVCEKKSNFLDFGFISEVDDNDAQLSHRPKVFVLGLDGQIRTTTPPPLLDTDTDDDDDDDDDDDGGGGDSGGSGRRPQTFYNLDFIRK